MRTSLIIAFLGIILSAQHGSSRPQQQLTVWRQILARNLESTPFRIGLGMNQFGNRLFSNIAKSETGNVVLSPFSLHTALSMTFFGSPERSETHLELSQLLGMAPQFYSDYPYNYLKLLLRYENLKSDEGTDVQFANRIFMDNNFTPKRDFQDLLNIFFLTTSENLDFQSQPQASGDRINQFIREKTNGFIKDIIQPGDIDGLTRLVIVNAIYFKADWKFEFNAQQTRPARFTVSPGNFFTHEETMFQKGEFGTANIPELDSTVLSLPYTHEDFRMLIVLPNKGSSIQDVKLDGFNLANLEQRLDFGPTLVQLPKFKAKLRTNLKEPLRQLGVETLFDSKRVNLTDISEEEQLSVKGIVHEAEIDVTESGSEAAAATAVVIGTRTVGGDKNRLFKVDRPFIFIIQDKKFGIPLFVGRIVDPTGQRTLNASQPDPAEKAASAAQQSLSQETAATPSGEDEEASSTEEEEPPVSEGVQDIIQSAIELGSSLEDGQKTDQPDDDIIYEDDENGDDDEDYRAGALVRGDDEIQAKKGELPDCDELGYENVSDDKSVSFPCKGRDASAPSEDGQKR